MRAQILVVTATLLAASAALPCDPGPFPTLRTEVCGDAPRVLARAHVEGELYVIDEILEDNLTDDEAELPASVEPPSFVQLEEGDDVLITAFSFEGEISVRNVFPVEDGVAEIHGERIPVARLPGLLELEQDECNTRLRDEGFADLAEPGICCAASGGASSSPLALLLLGLLALPALRRRQARV